MFASTSQDGPHRRLTTSADMRYLYNWNGLKGSGRSAQVEGFHVGGKTGTADKVINGRYAKDINFNAFVAAFPMDKPRYVALSIIDAPIVGEHGGRTAASTAAPMMKQIIGRTAALLGVTPRFGAPDAQSLLENYGWPRTDAGQPLRYPYQPVAPGELAPDALMIDKVVRRIRHAMPLDIFRRCYDRMFQ